MVVPVDMEIHVFDRDACWEQMVRLLRLAECADQLCFTAECALARSLTVSEALDRRGWLPVVSWTRPDEDGIRVVAALDRDDQGRRILRGYSNDSDVDQLARDFAERLAT